jgi:iron complex outermembrane receptor protein
LDHKLTFNGDFFWEDFSNFQANSFVNLNGVTVVTLKNAGAVRSYGAEFNTSWRATQDLTFVGGYTYDEATIVSYNCPSSIGAANVVTCLLHNGHTLPFAPKNKFNITSAYDVPIPQRIPFDVQVNSTYTYTSLINFDIDQTPLAKQPGYGLWDMAATITTKDGRYSLSFIGKNLTNQYYTDFITPSGNGIAAGSYTRLQVPRDAQRYVGVKATMNFH